MEEAEIVYTEEVRVYCDGRGAALGHPGVYLSLENKDEVACPYCGQVFKSQK